MTLSTIVARCVRFMDETAWGGGGLHVVLADGNLESANVQYCLEHQPMPYVPDHRPLAESLLGLSEDERQLVYDEVWSHYRSRPKELRS